MASIAQFPPRVAALDLDFEVPSEVRMRDNSARCIKQLSALDFKQFDILTVTGCLFFKPEESVSELRTLAETHNFHLFISKVHKNKSVAIFSRICGEMDQPFKSFGRLAVNNNCSIALWNGYFNNGRSELSKGDVNNVCIVRNLWQANNQDKTLCNFIVCPATKDPAMQEIFIRHRFNLMPNVLPDTQISVWSNICVPKLNDEKPQSQPAQISAAIPVVQKVPVEAPLQPKAAEGLNAKEFTYGPIVVKKSRCKRLWGFITAPFRALWRALCCRRSA